MTHDKNSTTAISIFTTQYMYVLMILELTLFELDFGPKFLVLLGYSVKQAVTVCDRLLINYHQQGLTSFLNLLARIVH